MTATTDTTSVGEDLFPWNDEDFRANPYPWYTRAREISPVHRSDERTYVVTRYDDAMAYAKLPVMSIIEADWVAPNPWEAFQNTVLSLDPPQHTRMRRYTNRWFTPKLVRQWTAVTRESTARVLDGIAPGQVVDGHFDIAVGPTHATMCRVLDMPEGEVEPLYWALWDAMLIQATAPVEGTLEKSVAGLDYMFRRVEAILAEKTANPGDGLADQLLAMHRSGEMTWREVHETVVLLYMSGAPNPAYLIGAALEVFAARPDVMRDFRDKPEARDLIVNEVARLNPVELIITRFPTEDVEIRGVTIPAGSRVKFPLGAANRDPEVFTDPDTFDHHRPPEASRNLTFGIGTHACAGQLIARGMTNAILQEVAERYTSVELAGTPEVVRTDRLVAYKELPVVLR